MMLRRTSCPPGWMEEAGKKEGRKEEGGSQGFSPASLFLLRWLLPGLPRDLSVTDKPIPRINDIRLYYQPLYGK